MLDTDYDTYISNLQNKDKLKLDKLEKLQQKRKKSIEGMLESDEDLDLSSIGQKYEKSSFEIVTEQDPIKNMVNNFLNVPYGLELSSILFVGVIYFVFSIVSSNSLNYE